MELVKPVASWKDLKVPEGTSRCLKELSEDLRRLAMFRGTRRPCMDGALFVGPSGSDKSLAAEVLAGEVGLSLLRVDLAEVVSKYVGETEKELERVFADAEANDTVLFFDEADALFGKRTEVHSARDRYANAGASYLLQRCESWHGIVILAPAEEEDLPSGFRRHLRWFVDFRG